MKKIIVLNFNEFDKIEEVLRLCSVKVDVFKIQLGKNRFVDVKDYSALVLSGDKDEMNLEENLKKYEKTIRDFLKYKKLILGIGGGHHVLAKYYDHIIYNYNYAEEGLVPVKLTSKGEDDQLFKEMPKEFKAYQNHKKFIYPGGNHIDILADNNIGIQALKYDDKVYGLQFHPEYSPKNIKEIIFNNFIDIAIKNIKK